MQQVQNDLNQIWDGWQVKRLIGEGSFGKVYKIERKDEFGHLFKSALKVITIPQSQTDVKSIMNDGMNEKDVREYFCAIAEDIVEEFLLMSKLKGNSTIVSYEDHAIVSHEGKIEWNVYIRMELLTPLFDYLKIKKVSVNQVIQLGIDMCRALEICQKYHIIHRDIKPENIFVSELGQFKLGDFGIAKQMEKTISMLSKKGTYTYMAPEVYKGKKYDFTADIYSLGIVLYRFLNQNRTPFLPAYPKKIKYFQREHAIEIRMTGTAIPMPCNAEEPLGKIILKACAYLPCDRYQTAQEMREELEVVSEYLNDEWISIDFYEKNNDAKIEIEQREEKNSIIELEEETIKLFQDETECDYTFENGDKMEANGGKNNQIIIKEKKFWQKKKRLNYFCRKYLVRVLLILTIIMGGFCLYLLSYNLRLDKNADELNAGEIVYESVDSWNDVN